MKGELLLLPNLLNKEAPHELFLPNSVDRAIAKIDGLIAENERDGRRYLQRFTFDRERTFRDLPISLFNKHHREVEELLAPLVQGEKWGLVSDAGLPILADPGYQLVSRARELGIIVKAFVGPSSLVLALMLSGLPSQHFCFHGYLPRRPEQSLQELEMRSRKEGSTHLFIEAPFRNDRLLSTLLHTLSDETLLCVAWDLTFPTQGVETHPVHRWRKRSLPSIDKKPAVFLFHTISEATKS
ncbi:MAG: Ribosomal RNA small subunit methyltransferase I [Chlamydiae bacterium]|nr:Ribosomal RNA small subunit methyltransferase I [Chlamydiota bacterium]